VNRWIVGALMFLIYAAFGLSWVATTPLIGDLKAALGLQDAQLGLLTTAVAVGKILAPLVTAWLSLRLGVARTLGLGAIAICACALTPFMHDFTGFLATRFVFGIGGAMVVTLLSPMTMQGFGAAERPFMNALNNVSVNTGITVTLFATVPLAERLGWQRTLLAYAALSVVLAGLWLLFGRDARSDRPAGEGPSCSTTDPSPVGYRDVWTRRETWIIALSFAGPLALYLALNTWLPRHLMESAHLAKATASQLTGLFNLVGIPTALGMGWATQKLGLRRPFILGAGLAMAMASMALVLGHGMAVWIPASVVLGMAFFTYTAPLFTLPMELPGFTPRHVALLMGTVFSVAYSVSALSPVLVGWAHDVTGSYVVGLVPWCLGSLVLAAGGWLLPETGPRARVAALQIPKA
jgi:CP family cyanate transporter-like MFS transporter